MNALGLENSRLIFDWFRQHHLSFVLPSFVAASMLMHLFGFYVFQVVFPGAVSILPPPRTVNFVAPGTPENDAVLNWIKAQDPALVAFAGSDPPKSLLHQPYVPSFAQVGAMPRSNIPETSAPLFPPGQASSAILGRLAPKTREAAAAVTKSAPATRIEFSGPLAIRRVAGENPLALERKGDLVLQPTRFLIGVTSEGIVRYLFLQAGSGSPEVDQEAETHLSQQRLAASPDPIEWGNVSYHWGADIYSKDAAHDSR